MSAHQAPQKPDLSYIWRHCTPYAGANSPSVSMPTQQAVNHASGNFPVAGSPPQSGNLEGFELDSPEIQAVKQYLQEEAREAGIGDVKLTVRYHRRE